MSDPNRYRVLYTIEPRPMRHGTYNVHSAHATFEAAYSAGIEIPGVMLYDVQEDLFYLWAEDRWANFDKE